MSDEVCVMCVVAVVLLLCQDHDFLQYSEITWKKDEFTVKCLIIFKKYKEKNNMKIFY
jgi:hypothetical protein